ncbi:hypothetical protein [Robertmurraya sp. P23]|uniref:hypothetical protein n=1 Tax=Robertmurraya sp. P23 TaxID=3436931 RepID=UPI003D959828
MKPVCDGCYIKALLEESREVIGLFHNQYLRLIPWVSLSTYSEHVECCSLLVLKNK